MEVIINEIMQALEIINIQYLYIVLAIVFGILILWKLK